MTREPNYRVIDPTDPNGPKYLGKVNVQNLKAAAHAYAVMEDMRTVQDKIDEKKNL